MAVSATEVDNYTVNTINNSLAIYVDTGASEHHFDEPRGLRGRLYPRRKSLRNREESLLQANTSWKEMLQVASPMLSSTKLERSSQ